MSKGVGTMFRLNRARGSLRFFLTAAAVLLCDQASKFWAITRLTSALDPEGAALGFLCRCQRFWSVHHPVDIDEQVVLPSCWSFRYVENPGAAWGFLSHSGWSLRTPFFAAIAIVAMGFLWRTFRQTQAHEQRLRFALAIVFGGALGNFLDRTRLGYVIDFIDWHYGRTGPHWPTFNVADAAITIGVALLMLDVSKERAPKGAQRT
jgi:signal peptidase II